MRTIRFAFVLALITLLTVIAPARLHGHAQEASSERPALKLLNWGAKYFPYPAWVVSVNEKADQAEAIWTQPGALVRYRIDFNFKDLPMQQVVSTVNQSWLKSLMQFYTSWSVINQCIVGKYLIYNLNAKVKDNTYKSRYWVWSGAEGFSEVFTAFDVDQAVDLESFAENAFGKAANCTLKTF